MRVLKFLGMSVCVCESLGNGVFLVKTNDNQFLRRGGVFISVSFRMIGDSGDVVLRASLPPDEWGYLDFAPVLPSPSEST